MPFQLYSTLHKFIPFEFSSFIFIYVNKVVNLNQNWYSGLQLWWPSSGAIYGFPIRITKRLITYVQSELHNYYGLLVICVTTFYNVINYMERHMSDTLYIHLL